MVNLYSPYSFCQHNSIHNLFCRFSQSYFDVNPITTTFMTLLSVMLPKDNQTRILHNKKCILYYDQRVQSASYLRQPV